MKKYRLIRRFWFSNGDWTDPQDLDTTFGVMTTNNMNEQFDAFFCQTNKQFFEEVTKRWKPNRAEWYFKIDFNYDDLIQQAIWEGFLHDEKMFYFGNCFRTEEEAKKAIDMIQKALIEFHERLSDE